MDEVVVERVLRAVECVPPGRVASYGLVGSIVGVGARHVGRIMAWYGSDVPWWRITNAKGEFPADLLVRALPRWADEGVVVRDDGRGCRYADHVVDRTDFETAVAASIADLTDPPTPPT